MFTFEEFKRLNSQKIGDQWVSKWSNEEMEKNYAIAIQVANNYIEYFGTAKEPKIGDIVEYADDFHVYYGASIVENVYGSEPKVCICESGHSFTTGKYFQTSGGAFHS